MQPWKVAPGERYVARRPPTRPEPLKRACVGVLVYSAGGGRRNAEICEPLRDRAARRCTLTGCAPPPPSRPATVSNARLLLQSFGDLGPSRNRARPLTPSATSAHKCILVWPNARLVALKATNGRPPNAAGGFNRFQGRQRAARLGRHLLRDSQTHPIASSNRWIRKGQRDANVPTATRIRIGQRCAQERVGRPH